jgi:multiple sugar transport system permease protein
MVSRDPAGDPTSNLSAINVSLSDSARASPTRGWRTAQRSRLANRLYPYILITPTFLILIVILAYPWLVSLHTSFQSFNPVLDTNTRFVGLRNYVRIFHDPLFWRSTFNTAYLIVPSLILEFLLGLGIASLLNRRMVFQRAVRTAILIPMMMAPALAGLMWRLLVHPDFGLFNYFLTLVGLPKLLWTASPNLAIPTIILVEVWQNTPFVILILLAGLQAIPLEQYEAARVDGATSWQSFLHITLPWLKPLIAIALLFRTIFIIRTFDTIMLLFSSIGGVGNSALVFGNYLYYQTYKIWDLGLSSAISYVILFVTGLLTIVYTAYLYRELKV